MKKKYIVAKIIKYKLRHGNLPKRMCKECGNTDYFIGTTVNYESVLPIPRGANDERLIKRDEVELIVAGYVTLNSSLVSFDKKVLKKFIDETGNDELNKTELIGICCLMCGADSSDIIDRDDIEGMVKRSKKGVV